MEKRVHEVLFFFLAAFLLVVCASSLTDDPTTMPSTTPGSLPNMNPVTTPQSTNPGVQPVTNPVSPVGLPGTVPDVPPLTTNAPAVPGQSWCVAKSGSLEIALKSGLDYACNIGGADCSAIKQGGSCFNPDSLEFHASYAFNSYYLKNPAPTSCDFGGTAMITNSNPSSGSCIFPTSSSSTSLPSPATQNPTTASPTPINPTPATSGSSSGDMVPGDAGTPPFGSNPSNPASGIPGETVPGDAGTPPFGLNSSNPAPGIPGVPVTGSTSGFPTTDFPNSPHGASTSFSMSSNLQPFISGFQLVISILTWKHILDI